MKFQFLLLPLAGEGGAKRRVRAARSAGINAKLVPVPSDTNPAKRISHTPVR
jgi:hypothetical protein